MNAGRRAQSRTLGRALVAALSFGATTLVAPQDATAPPETLAARLKGVASPFDLPEGKLSGKGAELLIAASVGTRYVALGEEHNTRAIPAFTTALFRLLHEKHGFDYLALEEGPALGRLLSNAARSTDAGAVEALARRYPNAFHMYTEPEFEMITGIGRISSSAEPIWGVNQEFGALHVFDRLATIASNDAARRVAQELAAQARAYEAQRFQKNAHYLVKVSRPEDFSRLREVYRPAVGSEADTLIEQTALSQRVYSPYGANPSPPSDVFLESGRTREGNMKHLLAQRCREAEARDGRPPRVLVKSGHLHLYRGLSPRTELYTLGNFLSEVATLDGSASLHVYTIVDRKYVREGWLAPAATASLDAAGTVFDLRPLYAWARQGKEIDPDWRRLILGYDLLVILRDGEPGSFEKFVTPEFRWYPEEK